MNGIHFGELHKSRPGFRILLHVHTQNLPPIVLKDGAEFNFVSLRLDIINEYDSGSANLIQNQDFGEEKFRELDSDQIEGREFEFSGLEIRFERN